MEGLIDLWASDARTGGLTDLSIDSYRYRLKDFEKFMTGTPLEKADKMVIRSYIEDLRIRKMTSQTMNDRAGIDKR